jgi:hypothetical protein
VWWNERTLYLFGGPVPDALNEANRWSLLELHWVYAAELETFGDPYWMLSVKAG